MPVVPLVLSAANPAAVTVAPVADLFGWLAGGIGIVTGWPQVWRLWAGRRHEGLSLSANVLGVLYCTAWLLYGVADHCGVQVATNLLGLVGLLAILAGHLVLTRPLVREWLPLLAGGLGLLAAMFTAGQRPLGLTAAVATLSGVLPQVLTLARARRLGIVDAAGVSRTRWRLAALANLLWVAYGLIVGDPVIFGNSAIIAGLAIAIVALAGDRTVLLAAASLEPELAVAA